MKRLLVCLALLPCLAQGAPPTASNPVTSVSTGNEGSHTLSSYTPAAGLSRLVVVGAAVREFAPDGTIDSCTYGGTAMTESIQVESGNASNTTISAIYYMLEANFPPGAADIVCTGTGSAGRRWGIIAVTLIGVDQATPTVGTNSLGSGGCITSSLDTNVTDTDALLLDHFSIPGSRTITPGGSQVTVANIADSQIGLMMSSLDITSTGNETMSQSLNSFLSSGCAHVTTAFKEGVAVAPKVPPFIYITEVHN